MLKISFAGCIGLSSVVSTQFSLEMSVADPNREKNSLKPYFVAQGRSRSSMVVPAESSLAALVMMSSKSVSICKVLLLDWTTVAEPARFQGGTQI